MLYLLILVALKLEFAIGSFHPWNSAFITSTLNTTYNQVAAFKYHTHYKNIHILYIGEPVISVMLYPDTV